MRSIKYVLGLLVTLCPILGTAWQSRNVKVEPQVTSIERKVTKVDIDDDQSYSPRVEKPAFQKDGPVVLLDEAHGNQHFDKAFAKLVSADGFQVVLSRTEFTFDAL